jgi:DNA-binding MarR family transcriptional regulator
VIKITIETEIGPLLQDAARLMRVVFDRRIRDLGLTQTQWRAIYYLSRNEGMNQAALADILEVAPISLTRLIDRMSAAGWVERRPDPNDRRAVRLYLRPQVQSILDEINGRAAALRAQAFKGLNKAQLAALHDALVTIKGNIADVDVVTEIPAVKEPTHVG